MLGRGGNALALVMQKWTEHQMELNGVFETKLSTTALALLLASRRPELAPIQVQHPQAALRTHAMPVTPFNPFKAF